MGLALLALLDQFPPTSSAAAAMPTPPIRWHGITRIARSLPGTTRLVDPALRIFFYLRSSTPRIRPTQARSVALHAALGEELHEYAVGIRT